MKHPRSRFGLFMVPALSVLVRSLTLAIAHAQSGQPKKGNLRTDTA